MSKQPAAPPTPKVSREWEVPAYVVLDDGEVVSNERAIAEAMLEVKTILSRIGGVFAIAAERAQQLDERGAPVPKAYFTERIRFVWRNVGTVKPLPPAPAPEPPVAESVPEDSTLRDEIEAEVEASEAAEAEQVAVPAG